MYTKEDIYRIAGRDDKAVVISFVNGSPASEQYGESISGVFEYSLNERAQAEERYLGEADETSHGVVKFKCLDSKMEDEKMDQLRTQGINSNDIASLLAPNWPSDNAYYSEERRSIRKLNIPFDPGEKGAEYDWMYGLSKRQVRDEIILPPFYRSSYLAMKLIYEPDKLTNDEKEEIYHEEEMDQSVEVKFLEILADKELISDEQNKRLEDLWAIEWGRNFDILKEELQRAGISLQTLYQASPALFNHLTTGTYKYIQKHVNTVGKKGIYLDWKGYLHIYLGHVKEFKVSDNFKNKDNFKWSPMDVQMILGKVVNSIDEEIQAFWTENPERGYRRSGNNCVYFEGDYYSMYIEPSGRGGTFFRHNNNPE